MIVSFVESPIFAQVPTVSWKDVVKELDHPGFLVRDRQGLVLLVTALRRALPTEHYIDLLYGRWNNAEGQVSRSRSRTAAFTVRIA